MFLEGKESEIHYLPPDNVQPDFPFVYLDWNVNCEFSEDNNEDKDKENSRDEKVTWDRDRYDYLEDNDDGYHARKLEGCIGYWQEGRKSSNTQCLLDQN